MRVVRWALVLGLAIAPIRAWSGSQPIYLALPPGFFFLDVSADGQRSVGWSYGGGPFATVPGYWDVPYANGMFVPIAATVPDTYVKAELVSGDGSTIAGETYSSASGSPIAIPPGPPTGGFRWDAIGGMTALPGIVQAGDRVAGISTDGASIFGRAGGKAARWDDGVLTILTPAGHPDGIAATLLAERADGRVIGNAEPAANESVPPLFLSNGTSLEPLFTPDVGAITATRATPDGTVVVGFFADPDGRIFPFRWRDTLVAEFTQLTTRTIRARSFGVSPDGSVVVGAYDDVPPPPGRDFSAFVWKESTGFRSLADVITAAGQLEPWVRAARAVASDDRTIVGDGDRTSGFVALLPPDPVPEPSAVAAGAAALALWRRYPAQRGCASDSAAGTS